MLLAHNFWSIHTETGYATFFTHPLNHLDLPFRTLSSVVDTDSFDALPVHFPMVLVDHDFEGTLPAGALPGLRRLQHISSARAAQAPDLRVHAQRASPPGEATGRARPAG